MNSLTKNNDFLVPNFSSSEYILNTCQTSSTLLYKGLFKGYAMVVFIKK